MRPYKRTAARKKNDRNAHGLPKPPGADGDSYLWHINKYGYDPRIHTLWDESWNRPPIGVETPENIVPLQKPGHIVCLEPGTIVWVANGDDGEWWLGRNVLLPTPTDTKWRSFVKKSQYWEPRNSRHLIHPPPTRTIFSSVEYRSTTPSFVQEKFVPGYVFYEEPARGRYTKMNFRGSYMFSNMPPLHFHWELCHVAEDGLEMIVKKIKHGEERYKKELAKLGMK